MSFVRAEIQRKASDNAQFHADPDPGESTVVAVHATCDVCGDGQPHRYMRGRALGHSYGLGFFHAVPKPDGWTGSGFEVTCPKGHGAMFSVADIYV